MILLALLVFGGVASVCWGLQAVTAALEHKCQKLAKYPLVPARPFLTGVVPSYNEDPATLKACIQSVLAQHGVDIQLIVVDDGSDIPVPKYDDLRVRVVRIPQSGKRQAQMTGVHLARHQWIVMVDSDTILTSVFSLRELYRHAVNRGAIAATGAVNLTNESQNWLTKMTACMYWFSFNQERASQSFFGCNVCCSGALSIYQKDFLLGVEGPYLNQKFLGQLCKSGDDRHLTNLALLNGHKVIWVKDATASTASPATVPSFLNQQIRWVKSHIHCLPFMLTRWRNWTTPFTYFTATLYFRYIYQMLLMVALLHYSIWDPAWTWLGVASLTILAVSAVKAAIAFLYTRQLKFLWLIAFGAYSLVAQNVVILAALLNPREGKWRQSNG